MSVGPGSEGGWGAPAAESPKYLTARRCEKRNWQVSLGSVPAVTSNDQPVQILADDASQSKGTGPA